MYILFKIYKLCDLSSIINNIKIIFNKRKIYKHNNKKLNKNKNYKKFNIKIYYFYN